MSVERFQGAHGNEEQIKETAAKKAEAAQAKEMVSVGTNTKGMLVGTTLDEEWRVATAMCKSGMLPAQYNSPEKVLGARQFAFELGLKPMTGLRQIAVIHGNPSLFGDLPLAIARGSGQLEKFKEFFIDDNGNEISYQNKNLKSKVYGAVCILKRKGMAEEDTRAFTLDNAKAAGLYPASSGSSPWSKYTNRMLQMRARSWALKDTFSDFLNGVAIAEYDFNALPEVEEAKPTLPEKATGDLNDLFADPKPEIPTPTPQPEAIEPVQVETAKEVPVPQPEPIAEVLDPERFEDGLYAGELVNSVPKEDLRAYYKKLRAKGLEEAKNGRQLDASLMKVYQQIEKELEM